MRRLTLAVAVAAAAALAWLASSANDPELQHPGGDAAVAPPPVLDVPAAQAATLQQAPRASAQDGAWWADSLARPLDDALEPEPDDPRAGVVRGRLTVRQQPWVHPAGVELRLTRSWLDSVLPLETEHGALAPERDELRTTTDEHGRFAFRLVPPAGELFLLIGHGTEWQDFQKVPSLPGAGEEIDLREVFLDLRGEVTGTIALTTVDQGRSLSFPPQQGLGGFTVRVVDDPLLGATSGFDEARAARTAGLELVRVPGSMRGGAVPEWIVRRDRFLPFPTATTDANGAFRVRGVRPGSHVLLVQGAGGHGRADTVIVAPGRTMDVGTVLVRPSGLIAMRFVDQDRQPWRGAQVAVLHGELGFGAEPVRTDVAGDVWVQTTGDGGRVLFARSQSSPWIALAEPPDWGTFVVPRAPALEVTLVDVTGRMLAGGTVRAYWQQPQFRRTDRALAPGLQPRESEPGVHVGTVPCPLVLVASVPGHAPAITHADAIEDHETRITMTLLPLHHATVVVRDSRGQPVEGAVVRAQVHDHDDMKFTGAQWGALENDRVRVGSTDADGELTVPVWPTWFSFRCSHRDYADTASPKLLPQPGDRFELVLRGGADVHGTLTIEGRPAPAGLRVRARQRPLHGDPLAESGFLDERLAATGTGGTFAFRRLVAGPWELTPELPAAAGTRRSDAAPMPWVGERVVLEEHERRHLVIEIQQGKLAPMHVVGSVMQNGVTVPGALVRLRPLEPAPRGERERLARARARSGDDEARRVVQAPAADAWRRCETDPFGTFEFRDLRAGGEYELRVDVPHDGRLHFVGRRVVRAGTASHPTRVDFDVPGALVRLSCTRDGQPARQRAMRLRQVLAGGEEGARYHLLLDDLGQAVVDHLPAGTWTIEPVHGGRCEPGEVRVNAGVAAVIDVALLER